MTQKTKELTTSEDIMKRKPSVFMSITIYLVMFTIIATIIWSNYKYLNNSEKVPFQIVNEVKEESIQPIITSTISEVRVSKGQRIKAGDTLIVLDKGTADDDISENNVNYTKVVDDYYNSIKLKYSITGYINLFDKNDEATKEYYDKYEAYANTVKLVVNPEYEEEGKSILQNMSNNEVFQKCVRRNKNYFTQGTSEYSEFATYLNQMGDYEKEIESIQKNIDELNISKDEVENGIRIDMTESQIDEQIKNSNKEINDIKSDEKKIADDKIAEKKKILASDNSKIKDLIEKYSVEKDIDQAVLQSQKSENFTSIDGNINNIENQMTEYEKKADELNSKIEGSILKASVDGVIDYKKEIKVGDVAEPNIPLMYVIPSENKVAEISIREEYMQNIKVGENIQYTFSEMGKNSPGVYSGSVKNIPTITRKDRNGNEVYTCIGTIDLNSNKTKTIKDGMIGMATITTGKEKLLDYFLKNIGLKSIGSKNK